MNTTKFEEAMDELNAFSKNAERLAANANMIIAMMHRLRANNTTPARDVLLPIIKDHLDCLFWEDDGGFTTHSDAFEALEETLASALKSLTGRKMQWHPHH